MVSLLLKCLFLLFISIFFLRLSRRNRRRRGQPPCPQSYPLIGNIIGFLRNRHRFHDWVTDMLSASPSLTIQVSGFLSLSTAGICTADPTNLHHLLRSNFPNYIKGHRFTSVLDELLGTGIFNSDGSLWSSQRKIASHEFNTKSLKIFISKSLQSQISNLLIPHLHQLAGETFDLQQILRNFNFYNICKVAFGIDTSDDSKSNNLLKFIHAFDFAVEHASNRLMSPVPAVWKIKRFFNIGDEKRYKQSIEIINEFAMGIIKKKEIIQSSNHNYESDEDLLTRFMTSSLDMSFENEEERRKFLKDIIISFIIAGKDSTASALTWFFWLLEGHPHYKNLIYKEFITLIDSSHPLNLTYDDLRNLHFLHAALSESMRLFPPVPINTKLTVFDDILPDGTFVGKGWFADYSVYAMGRTERLWGLDCRVFKPERWLDGNGVYQPVDQYKYPVFHGGFRMCLGKDMAYLQMKFVVLAIMYEFDVEVVDGGGTPERMVDPPYSLSLLLSMKSGLPVRLTKKQRL